MKRIVLMMVITSALNAFFAFSELAHCNELPVIYPQMGHGDLVRDVAISDAGEYAASSSNDESVKVWDLKTGRELRTFLGVSNPRRIAMSGDGKRVFVGGWGGFIRVLDVPTGREVTRLEYKENIEALITNYEGSELIVFGDADPQLWDVQRGIVKEVLGKIEVCSFDTRFPTRDIGEKYGHIINMETQLFAGCSNDGALALRFNKEWDENSPKRELALFDSRNGKLLWKFDGYMKRRLKYDISSNNRYLAIMYDGVRLWDLSSGKEMKIDPFEDGLYTEPEEPISFSADNRYLVAGGGTQIQLWDVTTGKTVYTFKKEASNIVQADSSVNGSTIVTLTGNLDLNVWDNINGTLKNTITINADKDFMIDYDMYKRNNLIALTKDNLYALTPDKDYPLVLRNLATGKIEKRFAEGKPNQPFSINLSEDETRVLTSTFTEINLWDFKTGRLIRNLKTFKTGSDEEKEGKVHPDAVFDKDGKRILFRDIDTNGQFTVIEAETGREIGSYEGEKAAFLADGRNIAVSDAEKIVILDLATGKEVKNIDGIHRNSFAVSPNGRYIVYESEQYNKITVKDLLTGKILMNPLGIFGDIRTYSFTKDSNFLITGSSDGTVRVWNIQTGRETTQFARFNDHEWIVVTPEGYYNASTYGDKHLNVRIGSNVYGIDNYRESLFRPDLVKIVLSGQSLKGFPTIADIKLPPKVSIVETTDLSSRDEATVTIRLEELGGGIGDVRLFLNGSAILLDNGRGLKLVEKKDKGAVYRSYTIKLSNGKNMLSAIAFNADNTMQSNPAEHLITASLAVVRKPVLHALVIGIQEFKNPKLELKYSAADANLFADSLEKGATGLFDEVKITRLTGKDATSKAAIVASLKKYQQLNPDDLFILYVASHGTVDDGEYYLITSNVGALSTNRLKADAISQVDLKELVANIPATKKMIVIDTCNAGKLGETLQVAMLTRGMSEETAMKVLSRAVGSSILSAATSVQEALEGYNGHGLFTWTLVEGMLGKADKGQSGYIKTTDLATYVEDEVPTLAEKVFNRAQYPTVMISGQGFPIGRVR